MRLWDLDGGTGDRHRIGFDGEWWGAENVRPRDLKSLSAALLSGARQWQGYSICAQPFHTGRMKIDLTWHSTPQLWIAMRSGVCQCPECKPPFGMGKTKEAAIKALIEWENDQPTDIPSGIKG